MTMDQVLSHKFFTEYAKSYDKLIVELGDSLKKAATYELHGRESIAIAIQKTEQKLKDEQKLVIKSTGNLFII
jgi:hypothetical protein